MNILLAVRNTIAHGNGRIEAIKKSRLSIIREWEEKHGEISTDSRYLSLTAAFVQNVADAVKAALDDLIARVKDKH